MNKIGLLNQLSKEQQKLVLYWGDALPHVRRDLANAWTDEVKRDFEAIQEESEKILFILKKLHGHYDRDKGSYAKELSDLSNLISHIRSIKASKEWVNQIHDDLQQIITDIELEKRAIGRRSFLKGLAASFIAGIFPSRAGAVPRPRPVQPGPMGDFKIIDNWSDYNKKRPKREKTKYIILHTTEAPDRSSINSVHRYGTSNFLIDTSGNIYGMIDMDKIAKHAGRSMWGGETNISNISVGIEVVGYHDKPVTEPQHSALRWAISKMKERYRLSDDQVLTHSMIAFGTPNRFHERRHRGRKRCGMLFALPEVRLKLGLRSKPNYDPDVRAGRLVVADKFLEKVLYGTPMPGEIARAPAPIAPVKPNYESALEIEGFFEIGDDKPTAYSIARSEYKSKTTIYFLPPPYKWVRMGNELESEATPDGKKLIDRLPRGTKILIGYVYGGKIVPGKPLPRIVGKRWNYPSTYYRMPNGEIKPGDDIDPLRIPKDTIILFRN